MSLWLVPQQLHRCVRFSHPICIRLIYQYCSFFEQSSIKGIVHLWQVLRLYLKCVIPCWFFHDATNGLLTNKWSKTSQMMSDKQPWLVLSSAAPKANRMSKMPPQCCFTAPSIQTWHSTLSPTCFVNMLLISQKPIIWDEVDMCNKTLPTGHSLIIQQQRLSSVTTTFSLAPSVYHGKLGFYSSLKTNIINVCGWQSQ